MSSRFPYANLLLCAASLVYTSVKTMFMKKFLNFLLVAPILIMPLLISCKKHTAGSIIPGASNRPPIANAGPDQTIYLPTNAVSLDGSASSDPDNNITGFAWTKISGPATFNFTNANTPQTQAINLVQGVYQFELKVTDVGGLLGKDTVAILVKPDTLVLSACDANRPHLNAQLITVGTLSQTRKGISVASTGNKILFAGGFVTGSTYTSRVDIYDLANQSWSTAELSLARNDMAAVSCENKIFFGGGENGDGTSNVAAVDIYDASSNTWSAASLSEPRHDVAGASVGNKVFFAGGGDISAKVDIYDISTNNWSTALLSEARRRPIAVTVNNKIYFAGGEAGLTSPNLGNYWIPSNRIDIYDANTNSWSTSSMIERKENQAAIAVGNKIYWAGGIKGDFGTSYNNSCTVEIRDVMTGGNSISNLSAPYSWWMNFGEAAVLKNNKIVFPFRGDNYFDIYDLLSNTWSIGVLPVNIRNASMISVANVIYVAGGEVNGVLSNQVWKLEF